VPELSRAQLAVYAAIAVVALLLGARWIRSADDGAGSTGSIAYGSQAPAEPASESVEFEQTGEDLIVHVAGAVREPGVYRLPEGSRVTDAIERAGGATGTAAEDAINLAARLADGQQVQVPGKSGQSPSGLPTAGAAADGPISVGTATVEQLDTIEGIGPVTAAAIVAFRDERGGIASIDELDEISGIGPATMEALRARLQP
jgi:competence protein ComEA